MQIANFSNFIAFGQRISIDLRVVLLSLPKHIHVSADAPNEGAADDVEESFVELAKSLYNDLCGKLLEVGQADLVAELERERALTQSEIGGSMDKLCPWLTFFYKLNNFTFKL